MQVNTSMGKAPIYCTICGQKALSFLETLCPLTRIITFFHNVNGEVTECTIRFKRDEKPDADELEQEQQGRDTETVRGLNKKDY